MTGDLDEEPSRFRSEQLHDLERSQAEARRGLGRASGVAGLVATVVRTPSGTSERTNVGPTVPLVRCGVCGRDVTADPWSYDEPPGRCCLTCGHHWSDAEGLASARARNATIHFGTPEIAAMKDAARGPVPKRPSLVQERRERAAAGKRKAKERRRRKARRKARKR